MPYSRACQHRRRCRVSGGRREHWSKHTHTLQRQLSSARPPARFHSRLCFPARHLVPCWSAAWPLASVRSHKGEGRMRGPARATPVGLSACSKRMERPLLKREASRRRVSDVVVIVACLHHAWPVPVSRVAPPGSHWWRENWRCAFIWVGCCRC